MTLGSEMATSQPPGPNMGPNNTSSQMATNEPNDLAALPPTVEGEDMPAKRKATTSFKITNVFLSRPPSNDGDDSCEDGEELEDSRTEVSASYLSQNSVDSGINAEKGKYTMCGVIEVALKVAVRFAFLANTVTCDYNRGADSTTAQC